jgi:hypothetical protein
VLDLSPEEAQLLRKLADAGSPVSEATLSQSDLRTLQVRRFVKRLGGFSVITADGRRALQSADDGFDVPFTARTDRSRETPAAAATAATAPEESEADADLRINALQEDVLRTLARQGFSMPVDDFDGRVLRALEGRGLVRRVEGRVEVTPAGRTFYESKVRRRRRARAGWVRPATTNGDSDERKSRAATIREAVDALRRAIGGTDVLEIGEFPAPADEAFDGLIELAARIERGADPRRITH